MEHFVISLLGLGVLAAWYKGKEAGFEEGYRDAIREGYCYTEGKAAERFRARFARYF